MGINPAFVYDWSHEHFVGRTDELLSQGYQPLSLSAYGELGNTRFAGVFDKRPGPPIRKSIGFTIEHFKEVQSNNAADGFHPILVSAVGGGSATRISVFYALFPAGQTTQITFEQSLPALAAEVTERQREGWIPRSATIYDDAATPSRVAAVWEPNTANVAWTAVAGLTESEHQTHVEAQASAWVRPAFVTGSSRKLMLAIYRDDHLGPINHGWVARHAQTRENFEKEYALWFGKGFHIVDLQGYGTFPERRFAALFVNNETPVPRTLRMTGTPAVPAVDEPVVKLMKKSNIRGASLAIVQGTRLVHARAYTWAEPDYPDVQPTTHFRLASCSKLVAALGVHQLVAEGPLQLTTPVTTALPLANPDGSTPTNLEYAQDTVGRLFEHGGRYRRYEGEGPNVAAAFGTPLPVTHEQIASYMLTVDLIPPKDTLDDFKYFLAGQVVKRAREIASFIPAVTARLLAPLKITRIRAGRSLLAVQPPDEARYHSRDLPLRHSVMSPERPLVPAGYGDENMETMETSGGLSAAAPDLARLLAAMNAKPYTPLGRPAVDSLLHHASINGSNGHGFDRLDEFDPTLKRYRGPKGGLLQTNQAGLWYESDGFCYVILWNGLHTGSNLFLEQGEGSEWYPAFSEVLDAAGAHSWPLADWFPSYGMPVLPVTEDNFRRCNQCRSLFLGGGKGSCPAGGAHSATGSGDYHLIRNSDFSYGQRDWRWCARCRSVSYGGFGPGTCPAGGKHDFTGSADYTVVMNSPYHEPELDWRYCHKCQALFHAGSGPGVCPAGGGHDNAGSANYSVAVAP